jgi:cell division protein FtsW
MGSAVPDTSSLMATEGAGSAVDRSRSQANHGFSPELQLWLVVLALMGFGFVMIYSASSAMALKKFSDAGYYLKRQALFAGLGLAMLTIARLIPYRVYRQLVYPILFSAVIGLILVLVPKLGVELNHAKRWLNLGLFLVQPAEFAKVAWLIYLSVSLTKKQEKIKQFSIGFLPHILIYGILSLLLLMEPDFGSCVVMGALTVLLLATAGVPWRYLLSLIPFAMVALYKFVYLVPYRWERITAFLNPWVDPLDSGYHLIQAWIAVGSGGFWGKGLGAGQQKLFFLPEPFTDFIFAVVGEELGFAGVLILSGLFIVLFRTGLRIARNAPDLLGSLLALAMTLMLSLQALVNMGVVVGLFPTKGLPLPFISYGGSALVANCLATGIVMNVARSGRRATDHV